MACFRCAYPTRSTASPDTPPPRPESALAPHTLADPQDSGSRTSSMRTGRCSASDKVAASATQPVSSASSIVHGEGRVPAATSVNATSDAREGVCEAVHEEHVRLATREGHPRLRRAHRELVVETSRDAVLRAVHLHPHVVAR